ncbi:tRNA (adenine22-N1)-methyltransferase [Dethiosulfatibacter aminovorans DSM 17477]|uniref:tRNA (Adenine22-N1)-methyltransferase n=1 Tax=Dethiosulfatibacter aminovorans DSM 17477 TaxID=1121476 RepID=A0A1M6DSD7_9FIRM|nr:class I SAM-dependent methyltransferase [Dethiosulfatibacter aminovorans]SHI76040.1 tRNA (adenine22-N1)-methyltransferase [Dethiosulfatibacter aminovorans DSM 17477]
MSERLKTIIKMFDKCNSAADIGTDHAYIPEMLIKNNLCKKVVATDVNEGPYRIAKNYVESTGLEESIEVRLGNGLQPVALEEVDTIVIAGMGGILITKILDEKITEFDEIKTLILQPMNAADKVRKYLHEKGFCIVDEEIAKEDYHYYELIKARKSSKACIYDKELFYETGRTLFEKKHPLLKKFVENKMRINSEIIHNMDKANISNKKKEDLKSRNEEYREVLKSYGIE